QLRCSKYRGTGSARKRLLPEIETEKTAMGCGRAAPTFKIVDTHIRGSWSACHTTGIIRDLHPTAIVGSLSDKPTASVPGSRRTLMAWHRSYASPRRSRCTLCRRTVLSWSAL